MRFCRHSLVFALVVAVPLVAGCTAAPRKRPVKMGDVNTGPGSLEAIRRQLQGTWELVEAAAFDASGKSTPRKTAGRLTYDEYGNLTIAAKLEDTDQAPSSVSGLLAYSGRAVIDPAKSRLVLMDLTSRLETNQPLPAEVSADKARYYTIEGNMLTLTVHDAAGKTTARTMWHKVN